MIRIPRIVGTACVVLVLGVCAPASADDITSDDVITFTIGQLNWDDPFGVGPDLQLVNYSDNPLAPTAPIPAGFVGGAFTNLNWAFTVPTGDPEASLFGTPPATLAPGASEIFGVSPISAVGLSFLFSYSLDGTQLSKAYSLLLNQPVLDDFSEAHTSTLINFDLTKPATAPVPEPSTLLLVGTGVLGLLARRREHKARHSVKL